MTRCQATEAGRVKLLLECLETSPDDELRCRDRKTLRKTFLSAGEHEPGDCQTGNREGEQRNEGLDYSVANREKPYFILGRYA
ncbi:hypothetical protein NDU88_007541 [Pleurodeles waltl]|uniref:Uncharacterized protein n=1 Tax=Pleurodeles waltl TaxID=8319 RepID=A0AAV7SSS7_PLEWA|nr:hypothetical protein NDU88_007541 [Pleurodeles waltl]